MKRRTYAPTTTVRGPIPERLAHPRIRDWVTDHEWKTSFGENAGLRLAKLAAPRYREAVVEWFREWCGPYDDDAPVTVADFETAQRAAAIESDEARIMKWARRVSIGNPIPWGP